MSSGNNIGEMDILKLNHYMNFKTPRGQRVGQSFFNFFEWLRIEKKFNYDQSHRMADPFHLSDTEFGRLYKEYLDTIKK